MNNGNSSKYFGMLMGSYRLFETMEARNRNYRAIREAEDAQRLMIEPKASEKLGSGRLATKSDFELLGLFDAWEHSYGSGLYLGRAHGRPIFYKGDGHLVTYGKTRSGKGTSVIFPVLAHSIERSFVVTDFKDGENAFGTADHRENILKSHCIFINPENLLGYPNTRINPLKTLTDITKQKRKIQTQAMQFAIILVPGSPEGNGQNEWVVKGARRLLALYMEFLAYYDPAHCNLVTLWEFASSSDEEFEAAFNLMIAMGHESIARRVYPLAAMFSEARKTFEAIRDQAIEALEPFEKDKHLANSVIGDDGFDFRRLKHEPITVYIMTPSSQLDAYATWTSIVINYLIEEIAKEPGNLTTTFLLDEFPQLPAAPAVKKALRLYAGKGIQLWPFSQGREATAERWSVNTAKEFENQAAVLQFWGIEDVAMIKDIEVWSGTMAVAIQGQNYSGASIQHAGFGVSEQHRPVLQSNEIRNYGDRRQLLKYGGYPYLLEADRIPWFEITPWKDQLKDTRVLHNGQLI